MPLFKIQSFGEKDKIIIKADNIESIIKKGKEKLKLAENINYKLVLSNDNTEIDDDEILLEYVSMVKEPLTLSLVDPNLRETSENNKNSPNTNQPAATNELNPTASTSSNKPQLINVDMIWAKVPSSILKKCSEDKELTTSEKRIVTSLVVNYMLKDLNTTKRNVASKIAKKMCDTFPKSFDVSINYDESWGGGYETFFLTIYNSLLYHKNKDETKQLKRHLDSDDEAEKQRLKEKDLESKQDAYGCINYAPLLTDEETSETQEALRLRLIELFNVNKTDGDINCLMIKTYPTLRAIINDPKLDFLLLREKWPFIAIKEHFIEHSNHLMGKNLMEIWTESLEKRVKITGQYLKSLERKPEIQIQYDDIIEEAKSATIVRKDRLPKYLVVFKLLILYFKEDDNCLFRIIKEDVEDNSQMKMVYPVVVIKGNSLYDDEAKCSVHINSNFIIECTDPLEGVLINILSYYVFGLAYHPKIGKTMEFIQRLFLKINPTGERGNKKKKRLTAYNPAVFKLAKKVYIFSDDFKLYDV